ncbi:chromophore lyase CpcT/CpeT [Flavobacterium sp. MAH-1]|uniref:Chromophore lyase CpcT/CpeT n=1 Tax=Flavobacterium agri TaxID=2743471 RepID=A0A7Y8Y3J6_9FLAO|nr:chromophore lyase CpcT/CpeT [Flavobacterium agri]NUY81940.1 chromophore lyase CpcT/CpeT [Flavobacterium agri]NYA71964.1 chromophore lyase CpcT/CpeT [Flavobacterium agri]
MKVFISMALLLATFTVAAQSKSDRKELDKLEALMEGYYSSEAQSKVDSANYFNISLRMVPIWKDRGHFLYVEQALASKPDKPYRVRIYKLSKRDGKFVSEIHTLKNEKDWIGKWKTPAAFDTLPFSEIELKPGCEVILEKKSETEYSGKTGIGTCPSELRGASYATSIVTITPGKILSWDQGFDKEGKQVWGAEKGGYVFIKK